MGDICTSAKMWEICYIAPSSSYKLQKFGTNSMIFKQKKKQKCKKLTQRSSSRSKSRSRSLKVLFALRICNLTKYLKFQLHILGRFFVTEFIFDQVFAYQTPNLVINEWNAHTLSASLTYRPLPNLLHFLIGSDMVYLPSKFRTILLSS